MKLQTYALASLALWLLAMGQLWAQTTPASASVAVNYRTAPFTPEIQIGGPPFNNPFVTLGVNDMAFSSPDTGVVVGNRSYVARTVNGGSTWTLDSIGLGNLLALKVIRINGVAHWVALSST